MAQKEIRVVINGEEFVSKAAKSASDGLDTFNKKQGSWLNGLADLKAGWDFLSGAVSRIWIIAKDAVAAFDELRASQRKLEGTSKLTGVALEDLALIANVGRNAFQLSTVVANDFAAEIAKLTQKAGQTDKAAESLGAFLDIGAARGLSAQQTLQAVGQAILGIDEGTDKLFGKNPSVIYQEFADTIGTTAGKLTDQQKAQALLNEALEGGQRVLGAYGEYLDTTAGKADLFTQKNREAAAELGRSMGEVRGLLLDVGGNVVPWFYDIWRRNFDDLSGTLLTLKGGMFEWVATVAKMVGKTEEFELYQRKATDALRAGEEATRRSNLSAAELAEENRRVSGSFVDVIDGAKNTNTAMTGLTRPLGDVNSLFGKQADTIASVGPRANMSAREVENYGTSSVRTAKEIADAAKKAADEQKRHEQQVEAAFRQYLATMKMLYDGALTTTQAMERLRPAVQASLEPARVATFNAVLEKSRDLGNELMEKMRAVKLDPPQLSTFDRLRSSLKDNAEELVGMARAGLDVAQSFGGISRESASALTSVINIGSSIAKMATGNPIAGITGIIGGVANIVSVMMGGDAERRRLQKVNNEALSRLSKDISGLRLNVTGEDVVSAQSAIGSVIGRLRGGRGAQNEIDVRNALMSQGLSMTDLERIAKEFGIELRTKNGGMSVEAIQALFQALGTVQLGKVGGSFADQLEFFRESQGIAGEQGANQASNLLRFLQTTGNVGALSGLDMSDPTKLRDSLIALRARLNSAEGIDERDLGRLTGSQFNSLLVELIGMLQPDNAIGSAGGTTTDTGMGAGAGATGGASTGGASSGGAASLPVTSIQDVIKAMDTNVAGILTTHTALHERIATATEWSAVSLGSIDTKMDTLIAVSAGRADVIDRALEAERFALAVQQGRGVAFG